MSQRSTGSLPRAGAEDPVSAVTELGKKGPGALGGRALRGQGHQCQGCSWDEAARQATGAGRKPAGRQCGPISLWEAPSWGTGCEAASLLPGGGGAELRGPATCTPRQSPHSRDSQALTSTLVMSQSLTALLWAPLVTIWKPLAVAV